MDNPVESRTFEGWAGPFKAGDLVTVYAAGTTHQDGVIALLNDDGLWLTHPDYRNSGRWYPRSGITWIGPDGWQVRGPE
ncbi:hypothetical protein Q5530_05580 [Saccharothrix sp. BKS2]|uniref:hypothetical protein n=1 Tax=Saccharothrix sp. BKS2 TaxID=3064400 RepID=UPI0039E86990